MKDADTARYWIAINSATCALSSIPWRNPMVIPTPQLLFGFRKLEEAQKAQQICLSAPIPEVAAFMESLRTDVKSGRVLFRKPDNPEPPTPGKTTGWQEGPAG